MEKENKQEITAIQGIYKLLSAVAGEYNNKENKLEARIGSI